MSNDNSSFHYATATAGNGYADYTLGSLSFVSCCIGMPGSLVTFGFFFIKRRTVSSVQHMMISAVDATITFLLLFNGISEFNSGRPLMFKHHWFCVAWAFMWQACTRLSIFLVAVLSISRAICLFRPFSKIKMWTIFLPVLIYSTILLGQQALPLLAGKSFWYARRLSMCVWLLTDVFDLHSLEFKIVHFCFITLQYVLPAFPIVACCLGIVWVLNRQRKFSSPDVIREKVTATKMTIYLTTAYIFFNTPQIIVSVLESITVLSDFQFVMEDFGMSVRALEFTYALIGCHSVALNSTTNVIIYFCRSRGLREFYRAIFTCNWKSLKSENRKARRVEFRNAQASGRKNVVYTKTSSCPTSTGRRVVPASETLIEATV